MSINEGFHRDRVESNYNQLEQENASLREQLEQANAQAAAMHVCLKSISGHLDSGLTLNSHSPEEPPSPATQWDYYGAMAVHEANQLLDSNTAGQSLLDELAAMREALAWVALEGRRVASILETDTGYAVFDMFDTVLAVGPTPIAAIAAARKAMEGKT